ncbi:uncharacterized protein BCR38DRAFT_480450 [Pseudomassariella vexata]|uniref:Uncharacterized protein n=1 Tax=Pseudomassariella vexata TaxID=1141098 RepID=A0A1Y2EKB7_9PEZI|nr:uncharacterized protein BCR38DRAFT_480450 [Pseudomassariella vexata]ORY71977.1 hypothetical protein BCR38DRAFT_480450 [Pseudomassariella vexata]
MLSGGAYNGWLTYASSTSSYCMRAEDERAHKYIPSLKQVCATSVYAAVSSELVRRDALYLEGVSIAVQPCTLDDAMKYGWGSWAFGQDKEETLWKLGEELSKVVK